MSNEKMRDEFEAAIAEKAGQPLAAIQLSRMADGYSTSVLIYAWWAWQASRESLVIELPEEAKGWSPDECAGADGFNDGVDRCRFAIEAAGLKVKS